MGLSADEIRRVRLQRGFSQSAFAEALGVSRKTVVTWENGHNEPSDVVEARLQAWVEGGAEPARPDAATLDAAYAAGVLWSIAQDAEHIARKAREAHERITGISVVSAVRPPASVGEARAQDDAARAQIAKSRRRRGAG